MHQVTSCAAGAFRGGAGRHQGGAAAAASATGTPASVCDQGDRGPRYTGQQNIAAQPGGGTRRRDPDLHSLRVHRPLPWASWSWVSGRSFNRRLTRAVSRSTGARLRERRVNGHPADYSVGGPARVPPVPQAVHRDAVTRVPVAIVDHHPWGDTPAGFESVAFLPVLAVSPLALSE